MIDIPARIAESRTRDNWPRHTNYMSDIGHPCERYLTYSRTHWEQREKPSPYLLGIFEDGNIHERAVLDDLRKANLRVTEEQMQFTDKDLKLSGKPDARITDPDTRESWILEIKSMSPFVWKTVEFYDDLVYSRYPWIRHYPAQMQCYLHYDREKNDKESQGIFLLKNKATAELKQINVQYDADEALELMLKAERINKAVDSVVTVGGDTDETKLPQRIPYHDGYCEGCAFRLVCIPDMEATDGISILDDTDGSLEQLLNRRNDLESDYREYQRIDGIVKKVFRGVPTTVVGEWIAYSKQQQVKARTTKAHTRWVTTIKRRGSAPE